MPPSIRLVRDAITLDELRAIAHEQFGDMVKAVVDVGQGFMAVGGDLHADEEATLLDEGSRQADLWGINLHPDAPSAERVEFDSMINLRPLQGNRSRSVEDGALRARILEIVAGHGRPAGPRVTALRPRHASLAGGRWQELSLAEQLGNVGSEVGRMRRHADPISAPAFERALELLDLTLADPRWHGRRKEIARTRELLCDAALGGREYGTTLEALDRYFLEFAVLARRGR